MAVLTSNFSLSSQPSLYHLVIEGLPQDPSSQQNACIITHPHAGVWPLVVDPLGMVEQWLRGREMEAVIVEHKVCLHVFVYARVCMFVCVTVHVCVCNCVCVYMCVYCNLCT